MQKSTLGSCIHYVQCRWIQRRSLMWVMLRYLCVMLSYMCLMENKVSCAQICATLNCCNPRYWVTYLGYRSDLYLNPCLWYQIIKHGKFMNTPILMAYEMQLVLPRAVQCNLASWTLFDLFCRLIFHAMATHNSSLRSSLQLVVSSLKADAKIALVDEANKFARALDFL